MNASSEPLQPAAGDDPRALLSALADGEAAADVGCALWRDDPEARRSWHAYHLIGDVLRSEDLATRPARDAAFLAALRDKLAAEPVVLAPRQAVAQRQRWLRRAAVPAAMAAGFVAVAGALVVARGPLPERDAPQVATGPQPRVVSEVRDLRLASEGGAAPQGPLVYTPERPMIRDPQLDAYLRAHRGAMGGAPAALPGGLPRNIETLAPAEAAVPAAQPR